jgi:hypothetical protein
MPSGSGRRGAAAATLATRQTVRMERRVGAVPRRGLAGDAPDRGGPGACMASIARWPAAREGSGRFARQGSVRLRVLLLLRLRARAIGLPGFLPRSGG